MISAITSGGQVRFQLIEDNFPAAKFIKFGKRLHHDAAGSVFLSSTATPLTVRKQ